MVSPIFTAKELGHLINVHKISTIHLALPHFCGQNVGKIGSFTKDFLSSDSLFLQETSVTLSSPAHKIPDNRHVKIVSADVTRQKTEQKMNKPQAKSTGER